MAEKTPTPGWTTSSVQRRTSLPGQWNETRTTIVDGKRSTDWNETLRARISNAPALYAGIGLVGAFLAVKFFR